jgi:hypothetical protein
MSNARRPCLILLCCFTLFLVTWFMPNLRVKVERTRHSFRLLKRNRFRVQNCRRPAPPVTSALTEPQLSSTIATEAPLPSSSAPPSVNQSSSDCFPYYSATFQNGTSTLPATSRDDWWCPPSMMTGFLGFSYPLEVSDCNDASNSLSQISSDFANMKKKLQRSLRSDIRA